MSSEVGVIKGSHMGRFSAIGLIIGGIFVIVFNILTPRPADPQDMQIALTNMSENFFMFQLGHLMLAFGLWLVMVAAAGVRGTIEGRGEPWAQAGFYGLVLATTLWSITYAMTSIEAREAVRWSLASGAEREALYQMTVATIHVGSAVYIMSGLLYWLAILFLGIGMARSEVYPGWLGLSAAIIGATMVVVVGIPQFMSGEVVTASMVFFASLAGLTSIWFVVAGIWILRRAL